MTETSDPTPPAEPPRRRRKRKWLIGCLTPVILIVMLAIAWPLGLGKWFFYRNQPDWVPDGSWLIPKFTPLLRYDGPGRLVAFMEHGCEAGDVEPDFKAGRLLTGTGLECRPGIVSELTPSPRQLFVHLPAGYDNNAVPYPVIIAFHGWGQIALHSVNLLTPAIEKAQTEGRLPQAITVMADFTISGDILYRKDLGYWPTGGSWGINSNLGRFEDHFWDELLPLIFREFNASEDPAQTVVIGGSMGGGQAVNMMIDKPRRLPNIAAFYPALDLRYSCNGDRLAPYTPECYQPLTEFSPERPMVHGEGRIIKAQNEKMYLFPVFDSDQTPGPVWTEDKPMWERIREGNPIDRLRDRRPDLTGVHFWFLAGDGDNFNIDDHAPEFVKLAKELGATIYPDDHIRPGKHDVEFYNEHLDEAIAWMNMRLTAK